MPEAAGAGQGALGAALVDEEVEVALDLGEGEKEVDRGQVVREEPPDELKDGARAAGELPVDAVGALLVKGDPPGDERGDVGDGGAVAGIGDGRSEGGDALEMLEVLEQALGPVGPAGGRRLDDGIGGDGGDEVVAGEEGAGGGLEEADEAAGVTGGREDLPAAAGHGEDVAVGEEVIDGDGEGVVVAVVPIEPDLILHRGRDLALVKPAPVEGGPQLVDGRP